jgi:hypothetical protein
MSDQTIRAMLFAAGVPTESDPDFRLKQVIDYFPSGGQFLVFKDRLSQQIVQCGCTLPKDGLLIDKSHTFGDVVQMISLLPGRPFGQDGDGKRNIGEAVPGLPGDPFGNDGD